MELIKASLLSFLEVGTGVALFIAIIFGGYYLLNKKFHINSGVSGFIVFILFVIVVVVIQRITGLEIIG